MTSSGRHVQEPRVHGLGFRVFTLRFVRERASDAVKQKIGSARLLEDECCAHGVPALACTFQCCRERKAVNKMQDRGQFYQSRKRALSSMQQAGPLCRKT